MSSSRSCSADIYEGEIPIPFDANCSPDKVCETKDFNVSYSDRNSSGDSLETVQVSTSKALPNMSSSDSMKYKTHYPMLFSSYKALEKEHKSLLKAIVLKKQPPKSNKKFIDDFLVCNFAIRVANKKEKFDRESTLEAINEGNALFTAKRWKRRYYNLIDAIDLLFADYESINNIIDTEPDKLTSPRFRHQLENRLRELQSYQEVHEGIYEDSDVGIVISNTFISDLISQCRIYKSDLEKQLSVKERLFYVLKKAKEQRSKLKLFVNTLREEIRYMRSKMKDMQKSVEEKYSKTEELPFHCDSYGFNMENADIHQLQGKIDELERILKEEETRRKKLHNKLQEIIGNIRVYCRIKPHDQSFMKVDSDDKILLIADSLPEKYTKSWGAPMKLFIFDKVFGPTASQADVFSSLSELIVSCVDGFNVCIMAYGQTGSGKTHTMMGTSEDPGINRRAIKELLRVCMERKQWTYKLFISMVEVYNEEIYDLLNTHNVDRTVNLVKILAAKDEEIILKGLTEHEVKSVNDIFKLLELGEKNRKVGSTFMNIQSSRSHLILFLKVNGQNTLHKTSSCGTLTLCDLAGSENISKSGASGERFQEATSINKSLTSLGRVFDALRKRQKPSYRETKLTFLLKPTLGGDSKCLLLINLRPEVENAEETLRAMHFGQNAMQAAPEKTKQKKSESSSSGSLSFSSFKK